MKIPFKPLILLPVATIGVCFTFIVLKSPSLLVSQETQIGTSSAIASKLQKQAKLITAEVDLETSIPVSSNNTLKLVNLNVGSSSFTFYAKGKAAYGIDLSRFNATQVIATDKTVVITIPSASLMGVSLDPDKLKNPNYRKDLFGPSFSPEDYQRIQKQAFQQMNTVACNNKEAQKQANEQAQIKLRSLLSSVTDKTIEIKVAAPSEEVCHA